MEESQQIAAVVALRRMGVKIPETGKGALVIGVFNKKAPAAKHLRAGDVILALNNRKIDFASELTVMLRKNKVGDVVNMRVRSAKGAMRTEKVPLIKCPPELAGACIGILVRTKDLKFDFPYPVDIRDTDIGGPSAGLAFSLAILDSLTPGELVPGTRVAATGTINLDGTVGEVGGVPQKTAAVREAGIKLFLVPRGEFAEAKARAGDDVEVVSVSTFQDALDALAERGGDVSSLPKKGAAA